METRVLRFSDDAIAEAARLVRAGEPVAIPTETVYGLAADATNAEAVARIYQAKGRPSFNPLIVHVPDVASAKRFGQFTALAEKLAQRFWPGPLTLVMPLAPGSAIASIATAGLSTIALRVPVHPAMQALLRACDRPLAAPSANASGSISPTRADHVVKSLGGRIALIVDAGPTAHGLESTIFDAEEGIILRPGPIARDQLRDLIDDRGAHGVDKVKAPGQLASHYAPAKPLRLEAVSAEEDEYWIGFGALAGDESLSSAGDLVEAAARLFDLLHRADASSKARIAVAPIPDEGLGVAINDRLRRAAANSEG